tara:strand:- start:2259 stop:3284 length:1026 start_codon:yes stop_codon:yes gene_type:complete
MTVFKINLFSFWLILLGFSVCIIILIGGYTRISDSGLSITQWQPISGILFPLSEAEWINEFSKYKKIDEFLLVNRNMTVAEFKVIYFWEWFHRAFARFIGILFILPFLIFFFYKKIPSSLTSNIYLIGFLLFIQAVVGWYMVKSGLVDRVDVSHYRLSIHLINAFIILGVIIFTFVQYEAKFKMNSLKRVKSSLRIFTLLLSFQIFYGAFVSGTHAGLTVNTWPTFNGSLIPQEAFELSPWVYNLIENKTFIIFFHRTFAFVLLIYLIIIDFKLVKIGLSKYNVILLVVLNISFFLQIILGIWMTIENIPWYVALTHQGNSILLFSITIYYLSLSIIKNRN